MRLAWVRGVCTSADAGTCDALQQMLQGAGWDFVAETAGADAVLVFTHGRLSVDEETMLAAGAGGRPVVLLGPSVTADLPLLSEASGLVPRGWTPPHPARLLAEDGDAWRQRVSPRGEEIEVLTSVLEVDKVRDSVEVWMSAPRGLSRQPMVTYHRDTGVMVFAPWPEPTSSSEDDRRALTRILHLALRRALGLDAEESVAPLRVGLLGYGAIGAEHARAAEQLPGLTLAMVCDRNSERLAQVGTSSPHVDTTAQATDLLSADLDLVVVSTPPDTHAEWAVRALEAGKHVVVEKPLSISTREADDVLEAARAAGRRAVTYQNRRFDPDFLAVRHQVETGAVGEVFHTETFIGGYGHPCNYWHSDADVSGGAIYDWGSHIIDQLLTLTSTPIAHVTCLEHKRRWFDVTNADHTSLQIRFVDGTESSFVHSDLAAALKPRWFLLGTDGGLVSEWRSATVVSRNEIGTLAEDRMAVTDAPPDLFRIGPDGARTALTLPDPGPHPFHVELVDDLLHRWPMSVTPEQSRRVVAVMEAARESAQLGGAPVMMPGET